MKGFLNKLKDKLTSAPLSDGLARTRRRLTDQVQAVLSGRTRLDDDVLEELEETLISADVGVAATERLLERLRERVRREPLEDGDDLQQVFAEEISGLLKAAQGEDPRRPGVKPHVVLLIGVNGTGKTTTLGKLANHHARRGEKVVVAAADTFRAAAVDQLRIWAERAGVDLIANESGGDPASVAFDAVEAARARGADVVFVDTAGRLQNKVNLMEELRKIGRVVDKQLPGAPHEVLLVLDATTGQNAVQQARQFGEVLPITGLVLTKLDGTAKGGVVLSIAEQLRIPVRYLGLGEGIDDFEPFDADQFAAALFAEQPARSG